MVDYEDNKGKEIRRKTAIFQLTPKKIWPFKVTKQK